MSQEALDIYRTQKAYIVEHGPSSEEFTIIGGGVFRGTFDKSYMYANKDEGNVEQQTLNARILVPSIPAELVGKEQVSRVTRVGDLTEYMVWSFAEDEEGIPVIW